MNENYINNELTKKNKTKKNIKLILIFSFEEQKIYSIR